MSNDPLHLAIIVGSTRHGRFGPTIASWFTRLATARGDFDVDTIDLAAAPLPDVLCISPAPTVAALAPRLAAADAFVVVTPEYNHSFPAPLKNALDWYLDEWRAKPVGIVSYGGISGGLRATEQLRQVFSALHAVTMCDTVSFHRAWDQFDAAGEPRQLEACAAAGTRMLDQLAWWARALRDARTRTPYAA